MPGQAFKTWDHLGTEKIYLGVMGDLSLPAKPAKPRVGNPDRQQTRRQKSQINSKELSPLLFPATHDCLPPTLAGGTLSGPHPSWHHPHILLLLFYLGKCHSQAGKARGHVTFSALSQQTWAAATARAATCMLLLHPVALHPMGPGCRQLSPHGDQK